MGHPWRDARAVTMACRAVREKSYAMPPSRPPIVVVAPDSFKGSLAAPAVCAAIARGVRRVWPDAEIRACPMADGGEGTLDAVLSRGRAAANDERRRRGRSATQRRVRHRRQRPKARPRSSKRRRSSASPIPTAWRRTSPRARPRASATMIRALLDTRRAALHDRPGRQQHQRRRRGNAARRSGSPSSTPPGATSRRRPLD